MARIGPLPEAWRYALLGGLLALPGTAYLYWQSGTELSLGPVLLGGSSPATCIEARSVGGSASADG